MKALFQRLFCRRRQEQKHEAVRAIEFALAMEDNFEQREFLGDWLHGDISAWPDFATGTRKWRGR